MTKCGDRLFWRILGFASILMTVAIGSWVVVHQGAMLMRPTVPTVAEKDFYYFVGLSGPDHQTVVPSAVPTPWMKYADGSPSRLAILLTDPNSCWLGLAHGLKSIGVPFRITRDVDDALRHRVVLVYPMISGKVLLPDALAKLAAFPRSGGTLIGVQVVGGGLNEVFGFREAVASRTRYDVDLVGSDPVLSEFTDPRERRWRIGIREKSLGVMGTYGYTESTDPLARFDDGMAAITQRGYEAGRAYAIGPDLGFLLLKGYNNRADELVRTFNNQFDPTLDVWLRLLKAIYRAAQPGAITLGTVPFGKALSVILTHDVDFTQSIKNAVDYAEYERSQGISGTYFIQTKYIRDYNDDIFFDQDGLRYVNRLAELGMELGSHTVAHSKVFEQFPLGTGLEAYPSYRPFVQDRFTAYHGSILGELRVSKFLLDHCCGQSIVSFRPGELSNPFSLPQALQATGYRFSSTATANNSLTHLPYQLNYDRLTSAEVDIFEFPVTIEDEELPKMGDRLPQALEVARQISRYGGACVILIHPNVLDHKLEFEKRFVERIRPQAWFGSIGEFGRWWAARNQVGLDVVQASGQWRVQLVIPERVAGLTLEIPPGWHLDAEKSSIPGIEQHGSLVTLPPAEGRHTVVLRPSGVPSGFRLG